MGKAVIAMVAVLALGMGQTIASADSAVASIEATEQGSPLHGSVVFRDTQEGLSIVADIEQAPAGPHGFHIHAYGSCQDHGKGAGGHYNPDGVKHGYLPDDGFALAHAGDLGNIDVGSDGAGHLDLVIPGLAVSGGDYNVAGRAVIMHAQRDDFSQPTGNAGARIGCGSILIVGE